MPVDLSELRGRYSSIKSRGQQQNTRGYRY
jgi:hypothetical protein